MNVSTRGAFSVESMVSAAELNAAIASVPQPVVLPPSPWVYSLRPSAPRRTLATRVATPAVSEHPSPVVAPCEAEMVWQASLDVSVWRSRPWWWRLAASLVVKRLGR